jgi:hypothetical protein
MSRCNARVIFLVPNNKGANVSAKIFVQLFSGRFYPPTKTHITHFYHITGSFFMFFFPSPIEQTRSRPAHPAWIRIWAIVWAGAVDAALPNARMGWYFRYRLVLLFSSPTPHHAWAREPRLLALLACSAGPKSPGDVRS